jgi:hypothetical protein
MCLKHSSMMSTCTAGSDELVSSRRLTMDEYDMAIEVGDWASMCQMMWYAADWPDSECLWPYSFAIWVFPTPPSPYRVHVEMFACFRRRSVS